MSEQNQTPKPRISLEKFEKWLVLQEPGWLLTPKAYLFCVDGCGPDEVCQRFGMVESISQRAGKTAEEIANWHKTNGMNLTPRSLLRPSTPMSAARRPL